MGRSRHFPPTGEILYFTWHGPSGSGVKCPTFYVTVTCSASLRSLNPKPCRSISCRDREIPAFRIRAILISQLFLDAVCEASKNFISSHLRVPEIIIIIIISLVLLNYNLPSRCVNFDRKSRCFVRRLKFFLWLFLSYFSTTYCEFMFHLILHFWSLLICLYFHLSHLVAAGVMHKPMLDWFNFWDTTRVYRMRNLHEFDTIRVRVIWCFFCVQYHLGYIYH